MNHYNIDPLKLPSLPLAERSQLPRQPCVYFVLTDESVLYIGRTVNLRDRWLGHHRWEQLKELNESVRVAWFKCSEHHLLNEIETALINHFEPPLNGSELPFKKPRTTVTFEPEDYEELQRWAEEEFRSVPQLILAIVKRELIKRRERKQRE